MKKALNLENFPISGFQIAERKPAEILNFAKIKRSNEEKRNSKKPEVGLWKAVIMQSVLDLMSNSSRAAEKLAKRNARDWLNLKNANFIKVCDLANLEPSWVLKKIEFALENPRTWRRECDLKKHFLNKES